MWLTRFALYVLLAIFLWRAFRRFARGVAQGMGVAGGQPRHDDGVRMVRDPVCGTFVIPTNALAVRDDKGLHHFCSDKCRDAFVAQARNRR